MTTTFLATQAQRLVLDTASLFFPNLCQACGNHLLRTQHVLCLRCQMQLPRTGFHLLEENPVTERFWGRVPVKHATSFLFFTKQGSVQHLIHRLKYKNKPHIGLHLGHLFGAELAESPLFSDVDYVVPVPLHPSKQQERGYNQAAMLAKGIAHTLGSTYHKDLLLRREATTTQTKKSRMERFDNVSSAFVVPRPEEAQNRHILLVDDVITTGATLEATAMELLKISGVKVSIATLAVAM